MSSQRGVRAGAAVLSVCALALPGERSAAIDYEPITLACMVANADAVIVAALPAAPDGQGYVATARRVLAGDVQPGRFNVTEPAPWRGTTPGFTTREALLFLRHDAKGVWQVIGPSGEGRIALSASSADVRGIALPLREPSRETYSRDALLEAIAAAARCFTFRPQVKSVRVVARCDNEALERASAESELHAGLLARLRDAPASGLPCRF